ncbi:hypothetical protein lerEdw1_016489 [Lerista edwardsae]|nr:hypothetical protein lerEdw1_016489 [Lerista edwardsae]
MLNALVIKVLAVAAIFLGLQLLSNDPSHWTIKIMGGFVGWEALATITLEVNLRLKKKGIYLESQGKVKRELLLLLIYLCGNLTFVIALLIGIGGYQLLRVEVHVLLTKAVALLTGFLSAARVGTTEALDILVQQSMEVAEGTPD